MKINTTGIAPESGGVIIIDKPSGITSHDVVNRVRRLYSTKKVGHTGTLDPMATGVLCVLVERAAKAAEYLVSDEKKYEAVLKLGVVSDTGDSSGNILSESCDVPDEKTVLDVISSFTGKQKQVPPMYSALKRDGVKLVDLARKGIEIERDARDIEVYSIEAEKMTETEYFLRVHCSKGTYIRTLCTDIGEKLGCGGVMASLRRTQSGSFGIENAHTLDELDAMTDDERVAALMPTESLFDDCPCVMLNAFFSHLAHSGNEIYLKKLGLDFPVSQRIRLSDKNGFFAIGEVSEFENGKAIKPIKQFVL